MTRLTLFGRGLSSLALCLVCCHLALAQATRRAQREEAEFGPVVRAYLGYLRAQQEVVDDRVSRREIDRGYYLHNSRRIRALRQVAMRIAREDGNDYLPELEAVSLDEFDQLFEEPLPEPGSLRVGELLDLKFKYIETVAVQREKFYVFARLDPYEQAELRKQLEKKSKADTSSGKVQPPSNDSATRPRQVNSP